MTNLNTINTDRHFSTTVIGAGPAGLAAAIALSDAGMNDFILIEREAETGGILNQCIHNGFGLKYYSNDLSGPEFARRLESRIPADVPVLTGTMACSVIRSESGGFIITARSAEYGILRITADSVITATGCRERTRENIEVPGTRPAGVFTAGQAQNLINRRHYSIGKRVVIQGSGDIGLIMARRLIIEGFEVAAVFERLPYLSGSIRNKVQCLDHFGIPLKLNRQITDIRGRSRVSSIKTAAVDSGFNPQPGTDEEYYCDTVLFAAGLIPELETVKTAGVTLTDGFHPDVNIMFETNIPGLFTAGNCLHINDLADTAAVEGRAAAVAALDYLRTPDVFRKKADGNSGQKPYTDTAPDRNLNEAYFHRLRNENLTVCIVCPRGCLLTSGDFGCSRGEEYYNRTCSSGFMQRVSTTIETGSADTGLKKTVPAVSLEEIPVKHIKEAVKTLKETAVRLSDNENSIRVTAGGIEYTFNLCRISKDTE